MTEVQGSLLGIQTLMTSSLSAHSQSIKRGRRKVHNSFAQSIIPFAWPLQEFVLLIDLCGRLLKNLIEWSYWYSHSIKLLLKILQNSNGLKINSCTNHCIKLPDELYLHRCIWNKTFVDPSRTQIASRSYSETYQKNFIKQKILRCFKGHFRITLE